MTHYAKSEEIENLADGMPIPAFRGTVVSIGPWRQADPDRANSKSFQPITFRNAEDGQEIAAVYKGFSALTDQSKGITIIIECKRTEQYGLSGLRKESYQGKPQLIITGSAICKATEEAPVETAEAPSSKPTPEVSLSVYTDLFREIYGNLDGIPDEFRVSATQTIFKETAGKPQFLRALAQKSSPDEKPNDEEPEPDGVPF